MRKVIGGLICSLFLVVNIWAELPTANEAVESAVKPSAVLSSDAVLPVLRPDISQATAATAEVPESESTVKELTNRLGTVESKTNLITSQLANFSEKIATIEKSLNSLSELEQKMSKGASYRFFTIIDQYTEQLSDYLGPQLFKVLVAAIIIILLMLLISLFRSHHKKDEFSYHQSHPVNQEHDFNLMEGTEGVKAKLNLARAYIEMGDKSKAKEILHEVLAHGSDAEQEEANILLAEIKQQRFNP